eukprot:1122256-Amphidinium_carterae.1
MAPKFLFFDQSCSNSNATLQKRGSSGGCQLCTIDVENYRLCITLSSEHHKGGLVQIFCEQGTNKIVGASIVAEHAGDMLAEITLAAQHGLKHKSVSISKQKSFPATVLGHLHPSPLMCSFRLQLEVQEQPDCNNSGDACPEHYGPQVHDTIRLCRATPHPVCIRSWSGGAGQDCPSIPNHWRSCAAVCLAVRAQSLANHIQNASAIEHVRRIAHSTYVGCTAMVDQLKKGKRCNFHQCTWDKATGSLAALRLSSPDKARAAH